MAFLLNREPKPNATVHLTYDTGVDQRTTIVVPMTAEHEVLDLDATALIVLLQSPPQRRPRQ